MTSPCPVPLVFWNLNRLHALEIWSEFIVLCPSNGKIQLIQDLISAYHIPQRNQCLTVGRINSLILGEAGPLWFLSKNGISPLEKPEAFHATNIYGALARHCARLWECCRGK